MRHLSKVLLILFVALALPGIAQDGPAARVQAYLSHLPSAKTLIEVKPYFSAEFWDYTYAPLLDLPPQEQAEVLTDTAESLKGFTVKNETISGNKAKVGVTSPTGEDTHLPMVKENGSWVIDFGDS